LRGEGTDYLATPLHFTNEEIHVASWAAQPAASARSGGADTRPALARIEIRPAPTEATLRDLYRSPSRRPRAWVGNSPRRYAPIHAASGSLTCAGFTRCRSTAPQNDQLLNRYFDCQVPVIEAEAAKFRSWATVCSPS
jgi:adenylate cyclase